MVLFLPQIVKPKKLKMKKVFAILAISAFMVACNDKKEETTDAASTATTATATPATEAPAGTATAAPAGTATAAPAATGK